MKHFASHILFILTLLITSFVFMPAHAERLMGTNNKILCGYENNNQNADPIECDIQTQKCVVCTENKKEVGAVLGRILTAGSYTRKVQTYKCISANTATPKNCKSAANGGLKGDEWSRHFYGLVKSGRVEGENCIVYNFMVKYANCYGCSVVKTLTSAFTKAAGHAYETSRQAANAIILVGMMLWLAVFAFKNVSSFAAIEPMKMLQEFFAQCFKVVLAMVILNSGIQTIINYTLVPIVTVGTDIADSITAGLYEDNQLDIESYKPKKEGE